MDGRGEHRLRLPEFAGCHARGRPAGLRRTGGLLLLLGWRFAREARSGRVGETDRRPHTTSQCNSHVSEDLDLTNRLEFCLRVDFVL